MKETKTNHLNNRKGGDCNSEKKKGRALQVGVSDILYCTN